MNFKKTILLLGLMSVSLGTVAQQREIFSNPVINADVPDPSMIRVGDYYYLVSTTMHLMPTNGSLVLASYICPFRVCAVAQTEKRVRKVNSVYSFFIVLYYEIGVT